MRRREAQANTCRQGNGQGSLDIDCADHPIVRSVDRQISALREVLRRRRSPMGSAGLGAVARGSSFIAYRRSSASCRTEPLALVSAVWDTNRSGSQRRALA